VTDLETRLSALGREIAFPPTPDLAPPPAALPVRRRHRPGRRVAVAVAVALAVLGAVLGLSQGARSAFRDVFHLGRIEVIRLGDPPPAAGRLVPFGTRTTLARARAAVAFPVRLPATEDGRPPAAVYLDRDAGIVSLVWCCDRRLVLSELATRFPGYLQKTIGPSARLERVAVDGGEGLWVEGAEHVIRVVREDAPFLERPVRVRGAVLAWERGGVTFRLEGDLSRDEALRIARTVR
jgi:hypothetical protein